MNQDNNIFISGIDSCHDFQKRLFDYIDAKCPIHTCTIILKNADHTDVFEDPRVETIDYDMMNQNTYRSRINMNDLLPLEKKILVDMKPYEDVAMHTLLRHTDTDVLAYDEARVLYLEHLRYLNHIIISKKINYILITSIPHQSHNYILYGLAKIYGIRCFLFMKNSFIDRNVPIASLESGSQYILREYNKLEENTEYELAEDIETHYQILAKRDEDKEVPVLNGGKTRKGLLLHNVELFKEPYRFSTFWKRNKSAIKHYVLDGVLHKEEHKKRILREQISTNHSLRKRGKEKLKRMATPKYYEKLCVEPDFNEKYVILFLHYQPEATTLPQGGVFADQEVLAELLDASLAKLGVKLYIKEHYVQPFRSKTFYNQLADLPNTKIISCKYDSQYLTKHSVAAATITGTIIQESTINNRPVLAFGCTAFDYAPGVFHCDSGEDIVLAVDRIMKGDYQIDQRDVRRYLKAFELASVWSRTEVSQKVFSSVPITEEQSMENLGNFIVDSLNGKWDL